jgi:hypothetical protein
MSGRIVAAAAPERGQPAEARDCNRGIRSHAAADGRVVKAPDLLAAAGKQLIDAPDLVECRQAETDDPDFPRIRRKFAERNDFPGLRVLVHDST